MKFNRDFFNNPTIPDYILCKGNKERIGILKCTSKKYTQNFNDIDEISFTTYMNIDDIKNPYYDAVDTMKYILLPDIGFFSISDCNIVSEGTKFEYKEITAKSYECLIAQKYLENFIINKGTTGSIDSVQFYNLSDKEHSLLHLVLSEKCPEWKIGHIDPSLPSMQRSFEVDRQDVYNFLMEDVATAFECIFIFNTLNNTINIYKEDTFGKDTNIYASYNNLLKNTNISSNTDDIKTVLKVKGSDDLTFREINMGQDSIVNIEYYNSLDFMSKGLYDAYNKWKLLREGKIKEYNNLLTKYQDYYSQINYLKNLKMPEDVESKNWAEYGLEALRGQLSSYEESLTTMMKAGWGEPSSEHYKTKYCPVYKIIQEINDQIDVVESELTRIKTEQDKIYNQMSDIMNLVAMEKNFTASELAELNNFLREDELTSDNYVVTDTMTDEERFKMLEDMLEYGEKELAKVSVPQLSFSADIVNVFAIPEFESLYDQFEVGNYIWISLREDYHAKVRLLSIQMDFYNPEDFSLTFGNVIKRDGKLTDITKSLSLVQSLSTSVSFNKSTWDEAAKDTDKIGQMLASGLLGQGFFLSSGVDSEMIIDNRGIFINTVTGDYAGLDSIFLGGGRILFTDDNWKTVAMAVGRGEVNGESRFGVFADFIVSGYIAGSIIEGGTIKSTNYESKKYGTFINLEDGTFEFNGAGEQKLHFDGTILTVKGTIKAEKGYIGGENGFNIESGKLYSRKTSLTDKTDGVYIGIDGIALGSDSVFKVDNKGNLTATSATITGNISASKITGSEISSTSFNNGNGTFSVDKDGKLIASSATITGDITANNGFIGGENGFTITDGKLYSGKSSISNSYEGVYIGTDGIALGKNSIFKVTKDGKLTASSAIITGSISSSEITSSSINNGNGTFSVDTNGNLTATSATIKGTIQADSGYIGGENGFTIVSGKIYSNSKSSISSSNEGVYIGTDGISLGANNVFKVDKNGNLTTTSATVTGTITGSTITGSSINNGNGTFSVDENGNLTATSATITGIINSSNGKIGGFTITSSSLYNGTDSLSSTKTGVYIGTDGIRQYNSEEKFVDIRDGVLTAYGALINNSFLYNVTIDGLSVSDLDAATIDCSGKLTTPSIDCSSDIHLGKTYLFNGDGISGEWHSLVIKNDTSVTFNTPNIYIWKGITCYEGYTGEVIINGTTLNFVKGLFIG